MGRITRSTSSRAASGSRTSQTTGRHSPPPSRTAEAVCLEHLGAPPGDADARAELRQQLGRRPPDAGAAAGDERRASGQAALAEDGVHAAMIEAGALEETPQEGAEAAGTPLRH